jgi:hypothetical protein
VLSIDHRRDNFGARSERCRDGYRDPPAPGRTAEKVVVNFGRICYPERCSPSRLGRHNANGLRRYRGEPYGGECDNRSLSGRALD